MIGTDRYMAPEQLADGRITPATDVYACGVVADEVLPESRSPELHEIVARCLRDDPAERFGDASELGDALATVEGNGAVGVVRRIMSQGRPTMPLPAGEATTDWPAPTDVRPGTPRRRGRRMGFVVALALIAAAAIVGAVIAVGPGDSSPPSTAKQERRAVAPVACPDRTTRDPGEAALEFCARSPPGAASTQQP